MLPLLAGRSPRPSVKAIRCGPAYPELKAARGVRAKSDASIVGRIFKHENPDPAGSFALCKSVADQLTADTEPLRVDRRLFRLSYAAMAGSFSMA